MLNETGQNVRAETGTPQGGILSPLLANIALNVLGDHFAVAWAAMGDSGARHRRRHRGEATYRLVATRTTSPLSSMAPVTHAEALRDEAAAVFAPMGLVLAEEKTRICHIDDRFDFLGSRIQLQPMRGSGKPTTYTWPTKKPRHTVLAKLIRERYVPDMLSVLRERTTDTA